LSYDPAFYATGLGLAKLVLSQLSYVPDVLVTCRSSSRGRIGTRHLLWRLQPCADRNPTTRSLTMRGT